MNEPRKLYTKAAVMLATFLGGPLGGSIVMRRNSVNLGRSREGNIILCIGILLMVFVGGLSFLEIEKRLDNTLNMLLPPFFVGLYAMFTNRLQGGAIQRQREEQKPFYSIWRAAGIGGIIITSILAVSIYGTHLDSQIFNDDAYQELIEKYISNDEKALKIEYQDVPPEEIARFIEQTTIPTLEQNLEICASMLSLESLPEEKKECIPLLKQYTELQIEKFNKVLIGLSTNGGQLSEINDIIEKIERILEELYEKDSSLLGTT